MTENLLGKDKVLGSVQSDWREGVFRWSEISPELHQQGVPLSRPFSRHTRDVCSHVLCRDHIPSFGISNLADGVPDEISGCILLWWADGGLKGWIDRC